MRALSFLAAAAYCLPALAVTSKRGLAEGLKFSQYLCDDLNATMASVVPWTYSWGLDPTGEGVLNCSAIYNGDREFVPMVWGKNNVGSLPFSPAKYLLGFNEPNQDAQSNILPSVAAALWPQLVAVSKAHNLKLISPAPAGNGVPWLQQFFGNCSCLDSVHAVAGHFYGCSGAGLKSWLEPLKSFGKPIWLTEFNCGNGMANASAERHLAFMKEALSILDADPQVERYAWMSSRSQRVPGSDLFRDATVYASDGKSNARSVLTPLVVALAGLPAGFTEQVVPTSVSPLIEATAMDVAPDGRVFVAQRRGAIRIVKGGLLLPTPFYTLPVSSTAGDLGLKGIALDPLFATAATKYVYVFYTGVNTAGSIREKVSRITVSVLNPDLGLAGSEFTLFEYPDALNLANLHNTAALHFGPDGMIYCAHGDLTIGSGAGGAQSMTTLWGKILRFNKDGSIPATNPFYGTAVGEARRIYALGMRNPYTFSFQGTDTMYIADVGEVSWEEVNRVTLNGLPAGKNLGWPVCEGSCATPNAAFTDPIYTYANPGVPTSLPAGTNPRGCAIIGSVYYNPPVATFPAPYAQKYFFTDYCTGQIMWINPDAAAPIRSTLFATGLTLPVTLLADPTDGGMWYLTWGDSAATPSRIGKVQYLRASSPVAITAQPFTVSVAVGQTATYFVTASGTQPFTYQWQASMPATPGTFVNIPLATAATYTTPALYLADSGTGYRCIVSNAYPSSATSAVAQCIVINNVPPVMTITSPANNSLYTGGAVITYRATATDAEDGTLPPVRFSWSGLLWHGIAGVDLHNHPAFGPVNNNAGTVTISTLGEVSPYQYYVLTCTVTDSAGTSTTASVTIRPTLATISLAALPAGMGLLLGIEGPARATPFTEQALVGQNRSISAPSPQGPFDGKMYVFSSWSDGGAASHTTARTPDAGRTYIATFVASAAETFTVNINFGSYATPAVAGFRLDRGLTFRAQNGASYGWATDVRAYAFNRVSPITADVRYRSVVAVPWSATAATTRRWEIAVPAPGSYRVTVTAGDALYYGGRIDVLVEGAQGPRGAQRANPAAARWITWTGTVTVTDGRLTLRLGPSGSSLRLCWMTVQQLQVQPVVGATSVVEPQISGAPFTVAGIVIGGLAGLALLASVALIGKRNVSLHKRSLSGATENVAATADSGRPTTSALASICTLCTSAERHSSTRTVT